MKFPVATPEYADFKTLTEAWDIVYPFTSRRLGSAIGINMLGKDHKVCSYDCVYCELGRTTLRMNDIKQSGFFIEPDALMKNIKEGFEKIKQSGRLIDTISIVGNGEPTLYPELDLVTPQIKELRDQLFPSAKIAILTNGSHLDQRKVQKALLSIDLVMVKLDAGNDKTLKKTNNPLVKDTIEKIIANARKIKNVVIQSCFFQGAVDNTSNEEIEDWIEAVGMIQPSTVHLYTLDRVPATSGLKKTDEDTLYTIAAKLEKRTRIKSKVFY